MDRTGLDWNRHQWVGERGQRGVTPDDISDEARWNLYQWVGEPSTGRAAGSWEPDVPDLGGGFSGFGRADGGGQRWATGYRRDQRERRDQETTEARVPPLNSEGNPTLEIG